MTTGNDLAPVPFDDPPPTPAPKPVNGTNGHESFETAAYASRLTPTEARDALNQGIGAASAMQSGRSLANLGRTLPHSLEAEEYLLSCCLLDGSATIAKCIEARIAPDSFYDTKHGLIFERLIALHLRREAIDIAVLAEDLKTARLLDQIGGYAFLTQVSSRVPTTAQTGYFIDKVRETAQLRALIRQATGIVEDSYNYSGGLEEFLADAQNRVQAVVRDQPIRRQTAFNWDDLLAFDSKKDTDCLMGRRFLGRTGACVIVAPSGVGKSVLALQLSACAALGQPFFGMQMTAPMRVLYVQAEDDFGDVAEGAQGFVRGYGATPDQISQLKQRLRIERWNDATGSRFIDRLAATHRIWPFDLVAINPLFSFCGCNVSEQSELSPFLRNGLNQVLNDTKSAAIVVHHTNKPPSDPKANDKAMDAELRYMGSGSAELTNWARAYITLQGVRAAGEHVHKMVFAKRGTRTGIVDEEGHATTSVYIEHSRTGLCWMPSDYAPEARPGGKFVARFDLSKALGVYDSSKAWPENELAIAKAMSMDPRSIRRHRQVIQEHG